MVISAPLMLQSVNVPPATAPNRIATMVADSSRLFALTNMVGGTRSARIPYFAGE
jgi:hypothetical protein